MDIFALSYIAVHDGSFPSSKSHDTLTADTIVVYIPMAITAIRVTATHIFIFLIVPIHPFYH